MMLYYFVEFAGSFANIALLLLFIGRLFQYDSARSYQQFLFLESFFIHNYVYKLVDIIYFSTIIDVYICG